jgi:dihydrofolate reductase
VVIDFPCSLQCRRKIIVYIATSADGYIARPDGDIEWLKIAGRAQSITA